MAYSTTEFFIAPSDGWIKVATNPTFLTVRASVERLFRVAVTPADAPVTQAVAAFATLTKGAGSPQADEVLTVDGVTYTLAAAYDAETPVATTVLLGADAEETFDNLIEALNGRAAIPAVAATGTVTFTGLPTADDTVTIGDETYTFVADPTDPYDVDIGANAAGTAANLAAAINASSAAVAATGTITLTGQPDADDTVTIGDIDYTFVVTPATAYDVKIGTTFAQTRANLLAAINATVPANDAYGVGTTAHPDVTATGLTGVITLTARNAGAAGNAIVLTESAANLTVSGSGTLAGGIGPRYAPGTEANASVTATVLAGVVTVTAIDAGFDGNAIVLTASADNTAVSGSGTLTSGANEVPALAANTRAQGIKTSATVLRVQARAPGASGNTIAVATDMTDVVLSGSPLSGGVDAVIGARYGKAGDEQADEFRFQVASAPTASFYVRVDESVGDIETEPVHFSVLREQA